jgi:hypothetical protein
MHLLMVGENQPKLRSISGDKADITWTLDITHEQYLKGMRLETRRTVMAMPVRQWGENYLHVYFLSVISIYGGAQVLTAPRPKILQRKWNKSASRICSAE